MEEVVDLALEEKPHKAGTAPGRSRTHKKP
jgi:hypothetical protein